MKEIEFKVNLYQSSLGETPYYAKVYFRDRVIYETNGFIIGGDALEAIDWKSAIATYNAIVFFKDAGYSVYLVDVHHGIDCGRDNWSYWDYQHYIIAKDYNDAARLAKKRHYTLQRHVTEVVMVNKTDIEIEAILATDHKVIDGRSEE